MGRQYSKALVTGKFMPLYKGHIALVKFATTQAEKVDMLVTTHNQESIPLLVRDLKSSMDM